MIGYPEYTLFLPPSCPTNQDHLSAPHVPVRSAHPETLDSKTKQLYPSSWRRIFSLR